MKTKLRFVLAGIIGFVADAGMLMILINLVAMGPIFARIFAIGFALSVTWLFNRSFTFGKSTAPIYVEGARYGGVGIISSLCNYLVYVVVLVAVPWLHPFFAVVIGSAAAMVLSWFGYSRLVFANRATPPR